MSSSDGLSLRVVQLQPGLSVVEIDDIPVEMPIETVETTVDCDGHSMISLQSLPRGDNQDLMLHSQEDIIVDVGDDSEIYSAYSMTVPHQELIETGPSTSKRNRKKKLGKVKIEHDDELSYEIERCARRWEQKQVQIKTLEGEFSVTMWASGSDEGMCVIFNKIKKKQSFYFAVLALCVSV